MDDAVENPPANSPRTGLPWVFVGPASPLDVAMCTRFGLSVDTNPQSGIHCVRRVGKRLVLEVCTPDGMALLSPDASHGSLGHRLRSVRITEPLPRAVGLHRRRAVSVVDATGGLGRDALVLASLGARVTAVERIPGLAALIWDLAATLPADRQPLVICGEAEHHLRALPADHRPDVVYLDPMFAAPGRAQVKKEMQLCRLLAGPPGDLAGLFALARSVARQRVVVKRHPDHAPLQDQPSFTVSATRIRFDVYLTPEPQSPGR